MISPDVGESIPPNKFNKVDLPLPLLPKIIVNPVFLNFNETLSSATTLEDPFFLYIFVSLLTITILILLTARYFCRHAPAEISQQLSVQQFNFIIMQQLAHN